MIDGGRFFDSAQITHSCYTPTLSRQSMHSRFPCPTLNKHKAMSKQAIGVFDSGIGGLSTLKSLRQQLPHENFIYVADLAFSPYGDKSQTLLHQRADLLCDFLIARDVKAIVIACNTATAASISQLRSRLSLPIIGVEPGIKPASEQSLAGIAGILATQRTLASEKFQTLLAQFSSKVKILQQACPGLAEAIEKGEQGLNERARLIQKFAQPLVDQGADTLVLGCTHYPLIIDELRLAVGKDIRLIDTSDAIARQVIAQLRARQILNNDLAPGCPEFYFSSLSATAGAQQLSEVFSYYWRTPVTLTALPS
jgi:glutamate racemase